MTASADSNYIESEFVVCLVVTRTGAIGREERRSIFGDFFSNPEEFLREFEKQFESESQRLGENAPKDLKNERRIGRGVQREYGPFVYGYSVKVGPDGKPIVREFGNVKPELGSAGHPELRLKSEREPLVDVIEEDKMIKVVAELPGVQKEDVRLTCTEEKLTIQVDTEKRKYYKEIGLPTKVLPNSAKATYTNGILEVALDRVKPASDSGHVIKVE